jgi:hypothetical protein
MSYYPPPVKDWIRGRKHGPTTGGDVGLEEIKNGADPWKIVDPCPKSFRPLIFFGDIRA